MPGLNPLDIRDRTILETLYATGIRRAELLALTIYDADLQTATLRIEHGKGNTTRIVPLTKSAIAALKLPLISPPKSRSKEKTPTKSKPRPNG